MTSDDLRVLQDVCSLLTSLPDALQLEGVRPDWKSPFRTGGEAVVYRAQYQGSEVIVRKIIPSPTSTPNDSEVLRVRNCSKFGQITVNNLSHTLHVFVWGFW